MKNIVMGKRIDIKEVLEAFFITSCIAMVTDFVKNGEDAYLITRVIICLCAVVVVCMTLYEVVDFVIDRVGVPTYISASRAKSLCFGLCSAVQFVALRNWLIRQCYGCTGSICRLILTARPVVTALVHTVIASCRNWVSILRISVTAAVIASRNSTKTPFWPAWIQAQPIPAPGPVFRVPTSKMFALLDDEVIKQAKQRLIDCSSVFRRLDSASQSNIILSIVAEIKDFNRYDFPAHGPHRTFSLAVQMLNFQFTNDIFELSPIYATKKLVSLNNAQKPKIFATFITMVFLIRYEFASTEKPMQSEEAAGQNWMSFTNINNQTLSTLTKKASDQVATPHRKQHRDSGYDSPHWHLVDENHSDWSGAMTIE